VFGSVARRTAERRSDVDLLIVKKTDARSLDRYEEFGDIYSALARWGLELLVYTPEELARNSDRPFVKTILTEGVTMYERGGENSNG
jgi:predicted nucleotidyltransferase